MAGGLSVHEYLPITDYGGTVRWRFFVQLDKQYKSGILCPKLQPESHHCGLMVRVLECEESYSISPMKFFHLWNGSDLSLILASNKKVLENQFHTKIME